MQLVKQSIVKNTSNKFNTGGYLILQTIIKRDGREVEFDYSKIANTINKAGQETGEIHESETILNLVSQVIKKIKDKATVEEIQDVIEKVLMKNGYTDTAKAYILYRDKRTRKREGKSELMDAVEEILKETHRENANVSNSPSAKMLQIASAASKNFYLSRVIPYDFSKAHREGDIHIHDLDFYGKTLTCLYIPLARLLAEGFDNGHGYIRPPKRPGSATALAAIILQSNQNDMHGGQAFAFFDRDMAPYMENADDEEVYQAMEALVYNLNSMHSRAGAQVPFSSINLGCDTTPAGRKVTRNFLKAFEAGLGRGENPIFPNVIFRLKEGINFNPGDPNYDLFQLAIRVASKRLNPTFSFMDSSFNKRYGTEVSTMGCRTRVIANRHGEEVSDGRGNLSFTTINLPRIALKSKTITEFWQNLSDICELTFAQLYERYCYQSKLLVKDMPFLMGQKLYMESEDLGWHDPIGKAIKHGTLSPGFIGLAETLKLLTGFHHGERKDAQKLGEAIVSFIKQKVDEAADYYDLNYTLLATPAEGLSGRFIAIDREKFGIIKDVTDKEFYTNSFHVPVDYPNSSAKKIAIEGPYHKYCSAGHISYIEMPSPPEHNPEAVESIIRHMAKCDMGYAGINYPIDFCNDCGYQGVINEEGCYKCGSFNIKRVRRITGYLSTEDKFNDAKKAELRKRVSHS